VGEKAILGGGIDKDIRVKAAGTRKRTEEALIVILLFARQRTQRNGPQTLAWQVVKRG
jgi:hypothetical protein